MRRNLLSLAVILFATTLMYLPGLGGELIFDDRANLEPIRLWLAGEASWQEVVFGNASGPIGRPLSMATFVANAAISGESVLGLKVGNLVLHLSSGFLLFFLFRTIAARDRNLAPHANWIPLALTAFWLLHPLLVGTVLYVVQRMAILSALFIFAALLTYVHGRNEIEKDNTKSGSFWIFIGVPTFTVLAALSKENGLLAPLLCGVIEWAYFIPRAGNRRPISVRIFAGIFIGFPVAAALLLLIMQPGFYLDGYDNRPFNPMERLLTQSRVLFDYLGNIVLPTGPKMSLLRDEYTISTGIVTPITTIFSIAGWLILGTLVFFLRRRIPGFSAGVSIFIVGHLMESTLFPLLIYFEHRNYLPATGIIWAVAAVLMAAGHSLQAKMDHPRPLIATSIGLILLAFSAATFSRASVWSSNEILLSQSLKAYPDSRHTRMELAQIEISKPFPNIAAARRHTRHLLTLERASTQLIGMINLIIIDCIENQKVDKKIKDQAFKIRPETIEADLFHAFDVLASYTRKGSCANFAPVDLAEGISQITSSTNLSDATKTVWRLRALAARLYYKDGVIHSAYRQAMLAWEASDNDLPTGMLFAGLSIRLGLYDQAEKLLEKIEPQIPQYDAKGQALITEYRRALDDQFESTIRNYKSVGENPIGIQ